jgi:hypothetical protein
MKKMLLPLLLLVATAFTLVQCDRDDTPVCTGDCVFVVEEKAGTITRLACFDRFGIELRHPDTDSLIFAIPDELDAEYEQEGKKVVFSGAMRPNTLTPQFPDPSIGPGSLYQTSITKIKTRN